MGQESGFTSSRKGTPKRGSVQSEDKAHWWGCTGRCALQCWWWPSASPSPRSHSGPGSEGGRSRPTRPAALRQPAALPEAKCSRDSNREAHCRARAMSALLCRPAGPAQQVPPPASLPTGPQVSQPAANGRPRSCGPAPGRSGLPRGFPGEDPEGGTETWNLRPLHGHPQPAGLRRHPRLPRARSRGQDPGRINKPAPGRGERDGFITPLLRKLESPRWDFVTGPRVCCNANLMAVSGLALSERVLCARY